MIAPYAAMVELADTEDLKSSDENIVPVQIWLAAPILHTYFYSMIRMGNLVNNCPLDMAM